METMTCYCKTDFCNDRNFRRNEFKKWQIQTEALFEVSSVSLVFLLGNRVNLVSNKTICTLQKNVLFSFQARISSLTWQLFEWVPEIFFYSVLMAAVVIILKFVSSLPQFSSKNR